MNSFSSWVKPTLLGPLLTTSAYITLGSVTVGVAAITGHRFDSWLNALLLGFFWSAGMSTLLLGADLVLLARKVRRLPTGGRAWVSSLLSPLPVWLMWTFALPWVVDTVTLVLALVGPMVLGAFAVRAFLGERPSASAD